MSGDLDPRLQRIIENAGLAVRDELVPEFSFARVESRTRQGRLGEGHRRSFQEDRMQNDFSQTFSTPVYLLVILSTDALNCRSRLVQLRAFKRPCRSHENYLQAFPCTLESTASTGT